MKIYIAYYDSPTMLESATFKCKDIKQAKMYAQQYKRQMGYKCKTTVKAYKNA